MLSPRYEAVPAVAAVRTRLPCVAASVLPDPWGPHPVAAHLTLALWTKIQSFFLSCGLLKFSFKSPFASDPLKDCLATKPYVNNVLSTGILLSTTNFPQLY